MSSRKLHMVIYWSGCHIREYVGGQGSCFSCLTNYSFDIRSFGTRAWFRIYSLLCNLTDVYLIIRLLWNYASVTRVTILGTPQREKRTGGMTNNFGHFILLHYAHCMHASNMVFSISVEYIHFLLQYIHYALIPCITVICPQENDNQTLFLSDENNRQFQIYPLPVAAVLVNLMMNLINAISARTWLGRKRRVKVTVQQVSVVS